MDDAHAVRIFERVEHADHHMLGVGDAQRAVRLDDVAQRLPLHILHDQVWQVFGLPVVERDHLFARIVDVHDVRVVHLGHGMRLTAEAGEEDLVMCEVGAHDLDGNGATQACIECDVHLGHATAANELAKLVAAVIERGRHATH